MENNPVLRDDKRFSSFIWIYNEESLMKSAKVALILTGGLDSFDEIGWIYGSAVRDILMTGKTKVTTVAEFIGDALAPCKRIFDGLKDRLEWTRKTEYPFWCIKGYLSDKEQADLKILHDLEIKYSGSCRIQNLRFDETDCRKEYKETYKRFLEYLQSKLDEQKKDS